MGGKESRASPGGLGEQLSEGGWGEALPGGPLEMLAEQWGFVSPKTQVSRSYSHLSSAFRHFPTENQILLPFSHFTKPTRGIFFRASKA